jgi:ATP-binding protein involved in chromosome partitioning
MSDLTQERVQEAVAAVRDPLLDQTLGQLRALKRVELDGAAVRLEIELPIYGHTGRDRIATDARDAVLALDGARDVDVRFAVRVRAVGGPLGKGGIPGVKNAIAVASGKGGVGKSTVAVNLAVALAQDGAAVGLLDADVYGPSIPLMLGTNAKPIMRENRIVPLEAFGVKLMSIGFLLPSDRALIWRGPLVAQLMNQFLNEVDWGQLDYLVVDLPPGTGDVQLTLVQKIQIAGAIIATTPQDVALADAVKGLKMFEEVKAPILGIVENMSYFVCPTCGERHEIFSHGGGERTAERYDVPLLGTIPLDTAIRISGDIGHPVVASDPDSASGQAFKSAARSAALRLAQEAVKRPHRPSIMLNPKPPETEDDGPPPSPFRRP